MRTVQIVTELDLFEKNDRVRCVGSRTEGVVMEDESEPFNADDDRYTNVLWDGYMAYQSLYVSQNLVLVKR
jgi:hypothetical protein